MYFVDKLYEPLSLQEASEILQNNEDTKIIAGGTDLLIKMRQKKSQRLRLVDIRKIRELKDIKIKNNYIEIGTAVTFTELAENDIIKKNLPMLRVAALAMGGPQIQNVATIGGNICNGATSAESAPSLFALNAKLELIGLHEKRIVAIQDFYLGPSKVDIKQGEILSKILIPIIDSDNKWAGNYVKFSVRKSMDISMLGCAVICVVGSDNVIKDLRIALGTAAPTPVRCTEAEKAAINKKLSLQLLNEVGNKAISDANPRTSWRASKEYRQHLIKELTIKTLEEVFLKAGGVFEK